MQSSERTDPAQDVVNLCRDLIRIDTSNPGDGSGPGERKAAEFVAAKLSDLGLDPVVVESAPGRANVLCRWGDQTADVPGLLLHGHLDVVPAQAADWQLPPFAGEVQDGYLWGRGAVDMKDFDAMLLSVIAARQADGRVPARPITLAFTADEEAGGHLGAERLIEGSRDWFQGCTEAVGEVGGFSTHIGDRRLYLIQVAEKGMAWMNLTARGTAGHGSMRHPDNAVTQLAAAVARVGAHQWPVRLTPAMEVLLGVVGEVVGVRPTAANVFDLIDEFGPAARMLGAVLSHTANPTMLDAGYKVNVVPGEAHAQIDGRIVPGFETEFFETMAELLGPEIEVGYSSNQPALATEFDGDLVAGMNQAILAHDPDALIAPYLMSGGTDAKHWSKLGMRCFGFAPLQLPADLDFTALFHGIDERVPVAGLEFGARVLDDFLDRI